MFLHLVSSIKISVPTKTDSNSLSDVTISWEKRARLSHVLISALLLAFVFFSAVSAHPLKWRNVDLDTNLTEDDPGWDELIKWSYETCGEEPLLQKVNRNQSSPQIFDIVPLDERIPKIRNLLGKTQKGLQRSNTLPQIVGRMLGSFYIKKLLANAKTRVSCNACKIGIGLILYQVRRSNSIEDVIELALKLCVSLRVQKSEACEGIMRMFGNQIVYVLQRMTMKAEQICSFVDMCEEVSNPAHEWEVSFLPVPKPAVNEFTPVEVNETSFKVLQISDTHLDLHYEEGANAKCDEMLCCRASEGQPVKPSNRAGRWGDYRKCDTPLRTLDNLFQHISSTHRDIDYILWTGDLHPHDLWKRTLEENLNILQQTVEKMESLFPGVPIFAALGNHDSWPPYGFPPPSTERRDHVRDLWYDELTKHWGHWLPSNSSRTIRRGAFYSILVRPGFRIISLNMNYCLKKNWWLFINSTDPANELQWLIFELQIAELNSEKVHVIGHIPPGDTDCLKVWSHNYYKIVARYESTISAQFFGHTHFDEFELFYDPEDLVRPVNIAYVGPSVTTYIGLNPGYRIYYVDGDRDNSTRAVLDYETWVMHLDEANDSVDDPVWYRLYSAKSAYQLPNLSPNEWNSFVHRLEGNDDSFNMFYKHYWKNSPVRPLCEPKCREDLICNLRSGRSHDRENMCRKKKERTPDSRPTDKKLVKKVSRITSLKKAISRGSSSAED